MEDLQRKQLEEQLANYKNEFQLVNNELDRLITTTNKVIEDAEKKQKELEMRREQIRGSYTAIYNILFQAEKAEAEQPVEGENQVTKAETITTEPVAEQEVQMNNVVAEEVETTNLSDLTETEVNQIQQVVKQENKKPKDSDIPDYLKEEYNK